MRALNRKLFRDLATLKGQSAAIAVVISAGVMTLIISLTTLDALTFTKKRFYENHQFADVFGDLKRAPDNVIQQLREIPGVDQAETRVVAPVRLEVEYFDDPVRGHLVSIPDGRQPRINSLHIREGRLPEPGRPGEVAVSEAFAGAHGLRYGDRIRAIIRGGLEELTIVGIVLSPEFVYQVAPTDLLPDYERYGILWMNRRALANAYGMDGAFNNVVLRLQAGAWEEQVIEKLDEILSPYGGVGAHGREDHPSHRFLSEELDQLRVMATVLPTIFLGVAAFLLHVLMGRIIRTQREQVALLKAFGYGNLEIGIHYTMLTGLIVLAGSLLGIISGAWASEALAGVYLEYFRFPELSFRLQPRVIILAVMIAGGASFAGVFSAVKDAVTLPPAEAMRPPAPERFRQGWIESSIFGRFLGQPTRIILRNISRHPVKSALSVFGIALSGALLVVGAFQFSAVDHMIDIQYRSVLKMDVELTFTEPTPQRALGELRVLLGVHFAEGFRAAPVRLIH